MLTNFSERRVPLSDPISLVFDVTDPSFVPQMVDLRWEDVWPRSFVAGESRAYLGAFTITLLTKPFTAGEDAAITWALLQDECAMIGCHHMSDGRDLMLLERMHVTQSRQDAINEQRRHLARKLESLGLMSSV
jgi:hypothetical protein